LRPKQVGQLNKQGARQNNSEDFAIAFFCQTQTSITAKFDGASAVLHYSYEGLQGLGTREL
jgi:hypothetical protein